jgi:ubiquinol-cytochrome c reductase cytochrome c1 subunit
MKNLIFTIICIFFSINLSLAETHALPPKKLEWPFDGMFGKVDRQSAQRGFQVFKEVCAVCHNLDHLYYRNLETPIGKNDSQRKDFAKIGLGFSAAEVKSIASNYSVNDTDDEGNVIQRKALPSDKFVGPYSNEKMARASNNGSLPPDLSLMIKARQDGANYVYSLLTGFVEPPVGTIVPEGQYYNPYFITQFIAMAPPLKDDIVTYMDGTKATIDQMAIDVVNFLQWAAEPEMEERKSMGIKVLTYLVITTLLFYIAKCRIWKKLNYTKE